MPQVNILIKQAEPVLGWFHSHLNLSTRTRKERSRRDNEQKHFLLLGMNCLESSSKSPRENMERLLSLIELMNC